MKLSEAILLGDSLKKSAPGGFLACGEGCALGGAFLAAGGTQKERDGLMPSKALKRYWPWLTIEHFGEISEMYYDVCDGRKTLEEIADYVRSIEPAENEPDPRDEEGSDVKAEIEVYRGR